MRRQSVLTITALPSLLFAAAAMRLHPRLTSALAAQAQTAQPAPVSAPLVQARLAPAAGKPAKLSSLTVPAAATETYTARRGETIPNIARQYLKQHGTSPAPGPAAAAVTLVGEIYALLGQTAPAAPAVGS